MCGGWGCKKNPQLDLRAGFRQNGFFADFYFWAAGFFRGFSRRIFCSSFLWEKVPRKILQENPRENPPKFIQQKSSDTFLQIGRANRSEMHEWSPPPTYKAKLWTNTQRAPGLKKFNLERQYWKNQAFNTEWNFQSRMVFSFWAPLWPQKDRARDWNFQSRMKFSNWEWKFEARMNPVSPYPLNVGGDHFTPWI